MHVLVTGGAGFLGINLIRHLLAKECSVTSIDIADFTYPEKESITVITGDIRDKETVQKAAEKADVVVHCASALPLNTDKEILSTIVEGTRTLLENTTQKFIYISSTAVYGIPDHHPIKEEDALQGVGAYGKGKIEAERLCIEARKQKCVPVIRPKTFVGKERLGIFAMLFEWAAEGKNFPLLNGKNRYQLLDVEDLCEAIYQCITLEVNDTFNIGSKIFTTMQEDFQAVLDAAGKEKKIICLPAKPFIAMLKLLHFLHLSPVYPWIYETSSKDSYVDISKAEQLLHFTPKYSTKEALLRSFAWYQHHKEGLKEGVSHRTTWNQKALKFAKLFF